MVCFSCFQGQHETGCIPRDRLSCMVCTLTPLVPETPTSSHRQCRPPGSVAGRRSAATRKVVGVTLGDQCRLCPFNSKTVEMDCVALL